MREKTGERGKPRLSERQREREGWWQPTPPGCRFLDQSGGASGRKGNRERERERERQSDRETARARKRKRGGGYRPVHVINIKFNKRLARS